MIAFFFIRTTTNITSNDEDSNQDSIITIQNSDDEEKENVPFLKRRRSSSNSDQMKIFETIAKTIKENHSRKIELINQMQKPQNELELFFASMCKTVEKFDALDQAKIKFEISQMVSQYEMTQIQAASSSRILHVTTYQHSEYQTPTDDTTDASYYDL